MTTAARMLQGLGITARGMDSKTREKRIRYFWFLSTVDTFAAIMFGRAPSFPRAMFEKVPMIKIEEMLTYQPTLQPKNLNDDQAPRRSLFGARWLHYAHLLSKTMFDVWVCLYDTLPAGRTAETIKESLDSWHQKAIKVIIVTIRISTLY